MAKINYNGRELTVMRSEYQYGSCKQLAILCFDEADPECCVASGIPYGILTVNLDDPRCEPFGDGTYAMQFVDVNNWPGIEKLLDECDWAERTYDFVQSGFVEYPLWLFRTDMLDHV